MYIKVQILALKLQAIAEDFNCQKCRGYSLPHPVHVHFELQSGKEKESAEI